jgi:hypothetical protein
MTRVRRYGKWSNRAFRAGAAAMSLGAVVRLWWMMRWHGKMVVLWYWQELDAEERQTFADLAVRALRRAAVEAEQAIEELRSKARREATLMALAQDDIDFRPKP